MDQFVSRFLSAFHIDMSVLYQPEEKETNGRRFVPDEAGPEKTTTAFVTY